MKTSKFVYLLCVVAASIFCLDAQAQDDSQLKDKVEKVTKELPQKGKPVEKAGKDAIDKVSKGKPVEGAQAKIAEIKEMYMAKIANAKTDEEKAELKEKMYQEIEEIQGSSAISNQVSKGDSSMSELETKVKAVREKYSELLKNASSDEERGEIRKAMHNEIKALRGGTSAVSTNNTVSKNDGPVVKDDEARDDAKSDGNFSGALDRTAKLKAAESKLVKSQGSMSQGMKTIEKARARVSAAKEKLQSDIDAGGLSKEAIMKREEKIRSVENQINVLEAAVNKGKDVNTNAGKRLNSFEKSEN